MIHLLEARHIIGCFDVGLRVAITYEYGEVAVEYHFVKHRLQEHGNYEICCVYYNSHSVDPLKICGTRLPLHSFDAILVQKDYYYVGNKKFIRKSIHALPYDWYPCFETSPKRRLLDITQQVEQGKKLGEELHAVRVNQFKLFDE